MYSVQTSFPKDSSISCLHENSNGLTYHLEVVQNPTRARATGWGSKGKISTFFYTFNLNSNNLNF